MSRLAWLGGAAAAFDQDVTGWLGRQGFDVHRIGLLGRPRWTVPLVTKWARLATYRRLLRQEGRGPLVLPYLAGDSLLLAGKVGAPLLGVALGSDVHLRSREPAPEMRFRRAILTLDGLWAVSHELGDALRTIGRAPDFVAGVGVEIGELPATVARRPEEGRLLSARRDGPVYRRAMIRDAVKGWTGTTLVESTEWPRERLLAEMSRAELVISVPETDGAPATVMEALCVGAHVVATGSTTVAGWLQDLGGTYGAARDARELRTLLEAGRKRARRESPDDRRTRASRSREAFDRDTTLRPLVQWLRDRRAGNVETKDAAPFSYC